MTYFKESLDVNVLYIYNQIGEIDDNFFEIGEIASFKNKEFKNKFSVYFNVKLFFLIKFFQLVKCKLLK